VKPVLRWGAFALLAMLALPIVVSLSRNGAFVLPVWWAISYFLFSRTFPDGKKQSVGAISIQVGQLAWLLWLTLVSGESPLDFGSRSASWAGQIAVLSLGLAWLFWTQSRLAAASLLLFQIIVLCWALFAVSQNIQEISSTGFGSQLAYIAVSSILSKVIAISFLSRFLWVRRRAPRRLRSDTTAAVFD
jgi:hypothetical protein